MGRFDNQVVWITGASKGIGRATAQSFYDEGARVIVSARSVDKLEDIARGVPDPDRIEVLPLDLTDTNAIAAAVDNAVAWGGAIDVLVNNAGITQRAPALEATMESVHQIMELNFFAAVDLSRRVARTMIDRDRGSIVVVGSVAGYIATPHRSAYAASKAAIRLWCDGLRAELDDTGVSVTVVSPGYVNTEITKSARTADGSALGEMQKGQQDGISPDQCAREIVDATARKKRESLVGGSETWAVYLKRFLPGIVARIVPGMTPE
jgi:short-subunit dehydrogenase